jgi:ribosomal protein L11 methyltransferase
VTLPDDALAPRPPRLTPSVREVFLPISTERLWVGPPWATDRPAGKHAIVMDYRGAFGTGNHPTTYGCLAAVERFLAAHPGASVLDVGTGTGVLGIAARLLGAGRVLGIDILPGAVADAERNARLHGVELDVSLQRLEDVEGSFDLVVANLRPEPLVALAGELARRTRKRLVVSGVLPRERAPVEAAFLETGLPVERAEVIADFPGRFPLDSPHWLRFEYGPR